MQEIFKDIEGYYGLYQVSNLGIVRSLDRYVKSKNDSVKLIKGCIRKPWVHPNDGHYSVTLWKNGKPKKVQIHRLVASAFIPNPSNLPCINHKDENPANNCVDNLEWCTVKYNNNYGTAIERRVKTRSKPVYQYTLDDELVNVWPSLSEAGRNGFSAAHIHSVCNGNHHLHTHKGFKWSFKPVEKVKSTTVQLEFDFL